jgi:glycosyltransferase involved in cell wall biosynthesis
MPKVSVILPSYNHEKYIKESIASVLDQTYQDFEIIITDDGSRDRSVEIINRFSDPRIKLFIHSRNQGLSITANNCIKHSHGEYIAMLNSDDAWAPRKLELQVAFLDQHPEVGVVFGKVEWVDAESRLITDPNFPYRYIFDFRNRSRFKWLRHFFYYGNCLCHPSSLVRRECYTEVGMYDPSLANLQDFDLWIRICLKYDIHILNQKLVRFRRIGEEINLSGDNVRNRSRTRFENKQLLNHYLDLKDSRELLLVFPEASKYGRISRDLIPYFVARIALDRGLEFMALWGLEVIYVLMKNEKMARKLETHCDFTHQDFMRLARESNIFNLALVESATKRLSDKEYAAWILKRFVIKVRQWLVPKGSRRDQLVRAILSTLHLDEKVAQLWKISRKQLRRLQ